MAKSGADKYTPTMNSKPKPFTLLLLAAIWLGLATTGCQTAHGFGKDVQKLGDKIQEKSK